MALEIERKFLVEKIPEEKLFALGAELLEIEQCYLKASEDFPLRRLRKTVRGEIVKYFYTEKRPIAHGGFSREEIEHEISLNQYLELQKERNLELNVISKKRFVLRGKLVYELDVFPFFDSFDILEIELPSEDYHYEIPSFFKVLKEVTTDYRFTNMALAKEIPTL